MELTTITRKQAGRIYAAVKNHELDMDKGMVARMYDEADWGAPRGLGGRDRKAQVSHLIEALNEGNEREAQMYAEALWGDEDEADAIAEELEAADKAKAEREAEANADEARAAKADAMLAKIGEITGKNLAGVEFLGVETAEQIVRNWSNMLAGRAEWAEVEAAGAAAEAKGEAQEATEAEPEAIEAEAETPEVEDAIRDRYGYLPRLVACPGYCVAGPLRVEWEAMDGRTLEARVRRDGYLRIVDAESGETVKHGERCAPPFILAMWPTVGVAAERAEYADLDDAHELDELSDEIEEAWA